MGHGACSDCAHTTDGGDGAATLDSDLEWMALAHRGDPDAGEASVEPRRDALLHLLAALLGDWHEAEDALQKALWHAFRAIGSLREPPAFEGSDFGSSCLDNAGPAGSGERPGYQLEAVGTVGVAGDAGICGVLERRGRPARVHIRPRPRFQDQPAGPEKRANLPSSFQCAGASPGSWGSSSL